jgi:hypothetical protein
MTDDYTSSTKTGAETGSADDKFAWTEPEPTAGGAAGQAREWLTQLQGMIENLATQAAPVVREVGAKAAELAAIAGEKAGPVAAKAAELTGQAGQKLADKSRDFATDLRRDAAAAKASKAEGPGETSPTGESMSESATADEPTTTGVA